MRRRTAACRVAVGRGSAALRITSEPRGGAASRFCNTDGLRGGAHHHRVRQSAVPETKPAGPVIVAPRLFNSDGLSAHGDDTSSPSVCARGDEAWTGQSPSRSGRGAAQAEHGAGPHTPRAPHGFGLCPLPARGLESREPTAQAAATDFLSWLPKGSTCSCKMLLPQRPASPSTKTVEGRRWINPHRPFLKIEALPRISVRSSSPRGRWALPFPRGERKG